MINEQTPGFNETNDYKSLLDIKRGPDFNNEASFTELLEMQDFSEAAREKYPLPNGSAMIDAALVVGFERQAFISGARWAQCRSSYSQKEVQRLTAEIRSLKLEIQCLKHALMREMREPELNQNQ